MSKKRVVENHISLVDAKPLDRFTLEGFRLILRTAVERAKNGYEISDLKYKYYEKSPTDALDQNILYFIWKEEVSEEEYKEIELRYNERIKSILEYERKENDV